MLASFSVKWIKSYFKIKSFFLICIFLIVTLGGCGFFYLQTTYNATTGNRQDQDILLEFGTSLNEIADHLYHHKIIDHPQSFRWNARLHGFHRHIQAGEYHFSKERTLKSVLELLASGKTIVHKFMVIEGQTTKEVLNLLLKSDHLKGDILDLPEEGSLYPETYHYNHGTTRQTLIVRMQKVMKKHLTDLWQYRDPKILLTSPQQALVLASIVEKETPLQSEKAHVAGLFYNRLRTGMKLQSDPTVSYGLYLFNNRPLNQALSRAELVLSTPYNTYVHVGLPPAPICNPSLSSLHAVLHPLNTSDFYFVTDGTGGHVFSSNYSDHQRHHQALRQRRANRQKDN
ncbi:MAG: endolytic transglycosylase MltG [Janthinobacterium lividum]